jgi:hypothetical protein
MESHRTSVRNPKILLLSSPLLSSPLLPSSLSNTNILVLYFPSLTATGHAVQCTLPFLDRAYKATGPLHSHSRQSLLAPLFARQSDNHSLVPSLRLFKERPRVSKTSYRSVLRLTFCTLLTAIMKSTILALASILASIAIAQPHSHNHAQLHKRGSVVTDIVWVTDYDYVTETVDVTTTIWVSEGFVPPTSTTSSLSTSSSSSSLVPAQFFEPVSEPATTSSSSSSIYVAPIPSSTYVAPAPAPTTEEAPADVAPAVSSSSPIPVYVAAATPAVVYTPPAAATSAAPASSNPSGGQCSSGSPCEGDMTYYNTTGTGACGWSNDGDVENVVALPHGLMGTQSNGNPYCGLFITIQCIATRKNTTAKIVDKCMGCDDYSIDLSYSAFLDLDDLSVGRTQALWWFN